MAKKKNKSDFLGIYNLQEQLDLNVKEAVKTNKTAKGYRYFIPRWRCSVEIKTGDTIRRYVERILKARHNKSVFQTPKKLKDKNVQLRTDIIMDARRSSMENDY